MGILMCRYGITADTAFATLGRVSQAHNLKLRALSESVIATMAGSNQPMPREIKTGLDELSRQGEVGAIRKT